MSNKQVRNKKAVNDLNVHIPFSYQLPRQALTPAALKNEGQDKVRKGDTQAMKAHFH